jgi:hypothetical protein
MRNKPRGEGTLRIGKENVMKADSQDLDRPLHLRIPESEFRTVAGISAGHGPVESGVEFFGGWSNHGLPIIQLVVGPGPRAVHQPCHYEQDLDFFRRIHDTIFSEYGIEWNGGAHCHHTLGIRGPSTDDMRQVMGVTSRNGLNRWCEIITTFVHCNRNPRTDEKHTQIQMVRDDSLLIQVDAYLYIDPQRGQKVPIPILVLPGISPIRRAILASGRISPSDIGEYASDFPLGSIIYEPFGIRTESADLDEGAFEIIAEQCRELPEEAQTGVSFSVLPDSVIVALPLISSVIAHVEYGRKPPHEITAVRVARDHDETGDGTIACFDKQRAATLNQVYHLLMSPQGSGISSSRSRNKMKALFQAATHVATACISRVRHKK